MCGIAVPCLSVGDIATVSVLVTFLRECETYLYVYQFLILCANVTDNVSFTFLFPCVNA